MYLRTVLIKFATFAIFFNFTFLTAMTLPPNYANSTKFLVQITSKCFSPSFPIILIGKQSDLQLRSFHLAFESMVILSFSVTENLKDENELEYIYYTDDYKNYINPFPSNKFILNEIELPSLKKAFYKLQKSIWYNLHGLYFIKNTWKPNSCDNAYSYLRIAWEYDLLSVIYTCYDSAYSIQFYTFNPFSEDAPQIWKKVQIYQGKNGHPFVLFELIKSTELKFDCNTLNFNKALNLNGYPINLAGTSHSQIAPSDPSQKIFKIRGISGAVAELMWTKLNATVSETVSNYTTYGMVEDVLEGKFDYSVNIRVDKGLWKNSMYTYKQAKMCYVTKKRRLTAQEIFLMIVLSKDCLILLIIFLSFAIVLKYLDGDGLLSELLNLLRIFLGVNILHPPFSLNARIIYIGIIIILTLANSYSRTELYSIVTVPMYDRLIESEEDLINFNYTIYTLREYSFDRSNRSNNFIIKTVEECIAKSMNNFRSVCVTVCDAAKFFVVENSTIHLTEIDKIISNYFVYMCRKNFSLHKRLVLMFRQAEEAGLLNFNVNLFLYFHHKKNDKSALIENISLHQMLFSFLLLVYGLIISTVLFLVEFTYAYLKVKFAKTKIKVLINI